ncbi:uncharacterized protein LOC122680676 isoform X2 [Cervus elaphus]|uniref:uncharacterized protein LOC122680676 isoform X2 n=1 Tax=Cervus elaphus TaxID=9860 RepID=UPI001CC2A5E9|nr:uncharacterized protein LOC122680676 isoform X2 [Cervus elaphus]
MDRKEELPDEAGKSHAATKWQAFCKRCTCMKDGDWAWVSATTVPSLWSGSWAQEAFGVREEEGPRQSSADSPAVKAKGSLLMPSQLRMNRLPGGAAGGTCVFPAHDQAKSGLIAPLCLTAGRPWAFQMIRKNTHVHTAENNSHHRGKDFKRRTTTQKGAQEGTEFVQRQTPASEHLWLERGAQARTLERGLRGRDTQTLEHAGFSSWGIQPELLWHMESSQTRDRNHFPLTTGPPGKSSAFFQQSTLAGLTMIHTAWIPVLPRALLGW